MKGFFLLLLVTNMGFISWQFFAEDVREAKEPYSGVVRENNGLRLLSELSEAERPAPRKLKQLDEKSVKVAKSNIERIEPVAPKEKQSVVSTHSVVTVQCYQSSLLVSLDEARSLQASLNKIGIENSQRSTVETTNVNYWVKLKAYKNRAKANEAAELLRKNHVKDFFIVRSGRHENAISLGVFSTRERAQKRYSSITALNARLRKPVIEALELPAKRLVVHFSLKSDAAPAGLNKLLDSRKHPHLKKIACKS